MRVAAAVLSSIWILFGLRAVGAEEPGAVAPAYATVAGPVTVTGDNKSNHYRALVKGIQVFEQQYSRLGWCVRGGGEQLGQIVKGAAANLADVAENAA